MELSKQVCSRQQADRLRELGVTAPSIFYYTIGDKIRVKTTDESPVNNNAVPILTEDYIEFTCCHAYTVAELGAMLPDGFTYKGEKSGLRCQHWNKGNDELPYYTCTIYPWNSWISATRVFEGNNEAEARAEAVIFFIESKLITPEQCATNLNH